MPQREPHCEIVQKLLGLQQDGREAISSPTNWTRLRPLLEVPTDLDEDIDALASQCLRSGGNDVARWHFFIGSPGNGKSAAVGKLARKLMHDHGCRIEESESGVEIDEIAEDIVPHSLDVFEKDNAFPSARIVQDASVVKKPYAPDADPGRDLMETLDEAWVKGMSLVVCTNRGVVEGALSDIELLQRFKDRPWFRSILRKIAADPLSIPSRLSDPISFDSKRPVFSSVAFSARYLDSHSLLLGGNRTFELLIKEAVKSESWSVCESCSAKDLCPFRANMFSLADDDGRDLFVKFLRRAEVFSSQVIVFREALALLSYILAGCARDYREHHPCDWVRQKAARRDIFGLGSRRIHMCLFSSGFPRGLEADSYLRDSQLSALRTLWTHVPPDNSGKEPLECAIESKAPSTDVGIPRLLGVEGVFAKLDPLNGPLTSQFYDDWDGNYEYIVSSTSRHVSELDRQCALAWADLENWIENMPSFNAPDAYWAVRRWSSQFSLHLGAYLAGHIRNGLELDEFADLLELLWKDVNQRTPEERTRLRDLRRLIGDLLNKQEDGFSPDRGIRIARHVSVSGTWVTRSLAPAVERSPASGSLTISVRFGDARHHAILAAPTYLWLLQRSEGTMDERCISDELLTEAMDAKSRALASSEYAFVTDDVVLHIEGEREVFAVERDGDDGGVVVNARNKH